MGFSTCLGMAAKSMRRVVRNEAMITELRLATALDGISTEITGNTFLDGFKHYEHCYYHETASLFQVNQSDETKFSPPSTRTPCDDQTYAIPAAILFNASNKISAWCFWKINMGLSLTAVAPLPPMLIPIVFALSKNWSLFG